MDSVAENESVAENDSKKELNSNVTLKVFVYIPHLEWTSSLRMLVDWAIHLQERQRQGEDSISVYDAFCDVCETEIVEFPHIELQLFTDKSTTTKDFLRRIQLFSGRVSIAFVSQLDHERADPQGDIALKSYLASADVVLLLKDMESYHMGLQMQGMQRIIDAATAIEAERWNNPFPAHLYLLLRRGSLSEIVNVLEYYGTNDVKLFILPTSFVVSIMVTIFLVSFPSMQYIIQNNFLLSY